MFTRNLRSIVKFMLVFMFLFSFAPISVCADDLSSVSKTAKKIGIGESISAQLSKAGEEDYYTFTTKDAGSYIIRTSGKLDTVGVLYDRNLKLIKMNDEGDSGTSNFCIVSNLEAQKTYYVCVYGYSEDDVGDYNISVVKSDLLVQSFNEYNKNDIIANIVVFNVTKEPIKLSDLKLRYYYTHEGNGKQSFECLYSSIGEENVIGKIENIKDKSEYADTYVEISFNDDESVIESGFYTEVSFVIKNSGSTKINIDNDWSANNEIDEFVINSNITGYLDGVLNWGNEPEIIELD
ncbi:MAG TPA: cellulose binding domain-containing protein [Pseudobacteroides sp.]|nr:cellulose binding domain-containing protein [Pseudobacteroides sp.]